MIRILVALLIVQCSVFCYVDRVHYRLGYRKFEGVVQSSAYLDKTELIREFYKKENVLVTAPRNFGKSINIDMLREFYELKIDANGTVIPRRRTNSYRMFARPYNKATGTGHLNIYKTKFFKKHFARYPVIFVNFKYLNGVNWKAFQKGFTEMLTEIFKKHRYLLNSKKLTDEGKKVFELFFTRGENPLKPDFLQRSLFYLTAMLYKHYRRRCIVLIDEIDTPTLKSMFRFASDYMVFRMTKFIQRFVSSLLVGNHFVSRGLIHGNTRWAGLLARVMSGDRYYFYIGHKFRRYYGITDPELTALATKFKADRALLTEWYGGNRVDGSMYKTHNMYSVISYLKNRTHYSFYHDPNFVLNITEICMDKKVYSKFMEVLHQGYTKVILMKDFDIEQTMFIRNIINVRLKKEKLYRNIDLLFNFLMDLGYFTVLDKTVNIRSSEETSSILITKHDIFYLAFTNREIRTDFMARLHTLEFLKRKFIVETRDIYAFVRSVLRLSGERNSYAEFGKSVMDLFRGKGCPMTIGDLQHPLVAYAIHKADKFDRVNSKFFVTKDTFADLLIVRKDFVGVIIQFENRRGSLYALREIINKRKYLAFKGRGMNVDFGIYIGLYVDRKGRCVLTYLYNSTNLNLAQNLIVSKSIVYPPKKKEEWVFVKNSVTDEMMMNTYEMP